ncbi:MAG: PAS domain-containing protein, partial [Acidobacteriota bacterium]|nr:PAS domain-containing protein [Acidobacteriota bacterium]
MTRKAPTPSKRLAAVPASRVEHANGKKSRAARPADAQSVIQQQLFPIVGVGASAGGLEAFTALLNNLPPDSGMAFVLIQHLDPKHASQLTELLSKTTKMAIREVDADMAVEPNHVYVIAPGVSLTISEGRLRAEPRDAGRTLPIDHFLRSLAHDKGSKAIGVVLSGTASDGTLGLKSIKEEGGITFAQEPASAKFDGMPRSAIAAGVVDFVLTPEEIARRLVQFSQHPSIERKSPSNGHPPEETEFELNKIFHLLRTATGTDFTHYKHATIHRRLRRRMVLHSTHEMGDYIAYLEANPSEVQVLADDLLIRVTSFFRAPEALKVLASKVFPEIIKNRSPDDSIRIWVPGCATGEEAYSVAICLTELLERAGTKLRIQIFATDVSETAVKKARAGIYGMPAIADVSPERLKRFFVQVEGGYQIHKSIRDTCIFARQDLTKDPPFHKLDLITCCNVLIYFGPVLQTKALSIFHYALKPGGFLMLGPSESVGTLSSSFATLDRKLKLYSKQGSSPVQLPSVTAEPVGVRMPGDDPTMPNAKATLDVQKTAERMLLAQYAPAGVIVDDAMNVINVRGDMGPYLQLATGEPTYSLLKMAREGLVIGVRTAIVKARKERVSITQQARLKQGGEFREVRLKVVPINGSVYSDSPHFMVLFEEANSLLAPALAEDGPQKKSAGGKPVKKNGAHDNGENDRLKEELAATREYLQSIVEEQEASCEELKSANEEAQASNEELETAKEELQSANEELNTVNDEQRTRNIALGEANNDLTNVLTSINVPLVMVGKDLKIRRFTQPMERMLNLIPSDIGRSISDLKPNIDVPDLPELLRSVIDGASPNVRDIKGPLGRWFSLQALPYKVPGNKIEGALLLL